MSDTDPLTDLSSCVLCGYDLRDERVVRRLNGTRFVLHPSCAEEGLEGVGLASPHAIEGPLDTPVPEEEPTVEEPAAEPSREPEPEPAPGPRAGGATRLDDFT